MMDANPHGGKRLPRSTPLTEPWWEACRKGELLIQQCAGCGQYQFYPRIACAACSSDSVEWVKASGQGKIQSFTVIRQPVSKAYASEVPYVLALIRLDEGPVMMSSLVDCEPEHVAVGDPVEVLFEVWTDKVTMPRFRPAGA